MQRRYKDLWLRWKYRKTPVIYARTLGVQIGDDCQIIGFSRSLFGSEPYLVKIGNHVSVAAGVRFITHDGTVWVYRQKQPTIDIFAPIVVGNNVLIGLNAIIMSGVTIGDNCVIGAGALVTKDVPSGHIAVGMPARALKTIDEYWEVIKDKTVPTKGMDPEEKRRLLEKKFWGKG